LKLSIHFVISLQFHSTVFVKPFSLHKKLVCVCVSPAILSVLLSVSLPHSKLAECKVSYY